MFKTLYADVVGPEKAEKYQTIGFLASAACAEFLADFTLCPWEALKVRTQIAVDGEFPRGTWAGINQIWSQEGLNGFYKGL